MKLTFSSQLAIVALSAVGALPLAAQNYNFQNVTCNGANIELPAMDGAGVVVGNIPINGVNGGAIYYNSKCQAVPYLGLSGVSDTNWLIGGYSKTWYLVEPGGKAFPLPNYPGTRDAANWCCLDTAAGILAGNYYPNISTPVGFFYQNGTFTSLPWSDGTPSYWYTIAAMNNAGTVVGTYNGNYNVGFVLQKGKITLRAFPGAFTTAFGGVNDNGLVVGNYWNKAQGHANVFLYNIATDTFTDLNLPGSYGLFTAFGISNSGVIGLTGAGDSGVILATPVP